MRLASDENVRGSNPLNPVQKVLYTNENQY